MKVRPISTNSSRIRLRFPVLDNQTRRYILTLMPKVDVCPAARIIVRGVLLREAYGTRHKAHGAELLNISGRRVMELKRGANDVRALVPGVYFVR